MNRCEREVNCLNAKVKKIVETCKKRIKKLLCGKRGSTSHHHILRIWFRYIYKYGYRHFKG